jgi:hypothetical protein
LFIFDDVTTTLISRMLMMRSTFVSQDVVDSERSYRSSGMLFWLDLRRRYKEQLSHALQKIKK